jgi:hypothetical protein
MLNTRGVTPSKYHTWFTYKRCQVSTLGRSDLSPKNHPWYSLEITWLIDPSDGLNLMCNIESFFFKSFSFYLFKSFSFYQMIFKLSLELKLYLHLEFDLDLQFEYQLCAKYTPQLNDLVLFTCHASRSIQNQT